MTSNNIDSTVAQLADKFGTDEEAVREKFTDEELGVLADEMSDDSGPENITTTTARQIGYARVLLDEWDLGDDDAEENVTVEYAPNAEHGDFGVENGQYPNRREGWRHGVAMDMAEYAARAVLGEFDDDVEFDEDEVNGTAFQILRANEEVTQEVALESGRESIGDMLDNHDVDVEEIAPDFQE